MDLSNLTQETLRALFSYDPATGVVTRLVCTANRHRVGERVGTRGARGYLQATIGSRKYMLHQLIWVWVHGSWAPADIDHINRVRDDNRLKNLRPATRSENNHNASLSQANTSGYTGVCWDVRRRQWLASIRFAGKTHNLGRYPTPELASAAYLSAKRIHHPTSPIHAGAQP